MKSANFSVGDGFGRWYLVDPEKISSENTEIRVIGQSESLPFEVRRVYYTKSSLANEKRGGHAHKNLWQLMFVTNGAVKLALDNGKVQTEVNLTAGNFGLLLTPWVWRDLLFQGIGSTLVVLASDVFDEEDYVRSYSEFRESAKVFDSSEV